MLYQPSAKETTNNKKAIKELINNLFAGLDKSKGDVFIIALPGAFYNGLKSKVTKEYNECILNEIQEAAKSKKFPLEQIVIAGDLNGATLPTRMRKAKGQDNKSTDMLAIAAQLVDQGLNPVIFDNAENVNSVGNGALGDRAEEAFEENLFRRVPLAYMLDNTFREQVQQNLNAQQAPNRRAPLINNSTVRVISSTEARDTRNLIPVKNLEDPANESFANINKILNNTNAQELKAALNDAGIKRPSEILNPTEIGSKLTTRYYRDTTAVEPNKLVVVVAANDLDESVIKLVSKGEKVNLSPELVEKLTPEAKRIYEDQVNIRRRLNQITPPPVQYQGAQTQPAQTNDQQSQPGEKAEYRQLLEAYFLAVVKHKISRKDEFEAFKELIEGNENIINTQDTNSKHEILSTCLKDHYVKVGKINNSYLAVKNEIEGKLKDSSLSLDEKNKENVIFENKINKLNTLYLPSEKEEGKYVEQQRNRLQTLKQLAEKDKINDNKQPFSMPRPKVDLGYYDNKNLGRKPESDSKGKYYGIPKKKNSLDVHNNGVKNNATDNEAQTGGPQVPKDSNKAATKLNILATTLSTPPAHQNNNNNPGQKEAPKTKKTWVTEEFYRGNKNILDPNKPANSK